MKNYKRFVYYCAMIIGMLMVLQGVVLEWYIRTVLIPKDTWFTIYERIVPSKDPASLTMVALGDSRVSRALDLKDARFINLAYPSDNTFKMYLKAAYYSEQGIRPLVVLLQADHHIFTKYRAEEKNFEQYQQFINESIEKEFTSLNVPVKIGKGARLNYSFLERFFLQFRDEYRPFVFNSLWKYIGNGFEIDTAIAPTEQGALISYEEYQNQNPDMRRSIAENRARAQIPIARECVQPYLVYYYRKIIELYQKYGAHVVLIRCPLAPEYRNAVQKESVERVNREFENLSKEYQLELYDYETLFDDASYFGDPDHVNHKGAAELSALMYDRIMKEYCSKTERESQ